MVTGEVLTSISLVKFPPRHLHSNWRLNFRRTDWSHTDKTGEMSEQNNYNIPAELQETLLDFTVHYLVEKPPDIVDFAMEYFSRLQAKRTNSQPQHSEDEDMESEEDVDFGE